MRFDQLRGSSNGVRWKLQMHLWCAKGSHVLITQVVDLNCISVCHIPEYLPGSHSQRPRLSFSIFNSLQLLKTLGKASAVASLLFLLLPACDA